MPMSVGLVILGLHQKTERGLDLNSALK